jgi:hypothetical protein
LIPSWIRIVAKDQCICLPSWMRILFLLVEIRAPNSLNTIFNSSFQQFWINFKIFFLFSSRRFL